MIKLWQKIYGGKGYYTEWSPDVALMFAGENGVGVNVVQEVVRACLNRGIFDQGMYKKFKILTSDGVQTRYFKAIERRSFEKIDQRYLLVAIPSEGVNADNNGVFVDNNSVNVDNNHTNKSKVNKSKDLSIARDAREGEKEKYEPKQGSFDTDSFFDAAVSTTLTPRRSSAISTVLPARCLSGWWIITSAWMWIFPSAASANTATA